MLGHYCNIPPQNLEFTKNKYGKLSISPDQNNARISFSCSSSRDLAVIALSCGDEVGVDIEYIRNDFIIREASPQLFTRNEISRIENPEGGILDFFELWTKKEALAKARGTGIAFNNLGEVDLLASPTILPEVDASKRMHIDKLFIEAGYAGALAAVRDDGIELVIRHIPEAQIYS